MSPLYYKQSNGKMLACANGKLAASCHCVQMPLISLTGDLTYQFVEGDTTPQTELATVCNVGDVSSELNWARSLSGDAALLTQLTALPATGSLNHDDCVDVTVTVDPTGMGDGTYSGTFLVEEAVLSGVDSKSLPISVVVTPLWTGSVKALVLVWIAGEYPTGTPSVHEETMTFGPGRTWVTGVNDTWPKLHLQPCQGDGTDNIYAEDSSGKQVLPSPHSVSVSYGTDGYPSGGPVDIPFYIAYPSYTYLRVWFGPDVW